MSDTDSRGTFKGGNVSIDPPWSANSPTASATVIWLDALVRSLDLPLSERQQIRLELQSHIDDRVRDLMLEGTEEGEATRRALSECGEASSLASGFGEVKKALRRRTLMNIGVVGAACGLVALGFGSFRSANKNVCPPEELAAQQARATSAPNGQTYRVQLGYALASPSALKASGPSAEFKNVRMEEVLNAIAKKSSRPMIVNWTALATGGVERDTTTSVTMPIDDPAAAIAFLNEMIGNDPDGGPGPIAIRDRGETLELVSTSWLDKREAQLVVYDISEAADNGAAPADLIHAITQFIEPNNWKENGGDRAETTVVGSRLLVKAPARIHEGVKWMLKQFDGSDALIESTLSESPRWSRQRLTPMPASAAGGLGPVLVEPGHPIEPEQPVEPTEPGEPAGVSPTPASDSVSSKPVVLTLPMQHSQAELVAQLMEPLTNRDEHPLNVTISSDSSTNSLIFAGIQSDAIQCQQVAAVIDSALGEPPQISKTDVPYLRSIPILGQLFSGSRASLNVTNRVEISKPPATGSTPAR